MKAQKLVLCILLSLALVVTFIPTSSFAGNDDDSIVGITFVPTGQHTTTGYCDDTEAPYYVINFANGDKLTLKKGDGTSVVYIYTDDWAFVNENDEDDFLGVSPYFEEEIPYSSYQSGTETTIRTNVIYEDEDLGVFVKTASPVVVNTKIVMSHRVDYDVETDTDIIHIKKIAAVPASCTTAGNIEYWKCELCNKCFKDKDGVYEIAESNCAIPAGHKWKHVKQAAGLMKNGSEYDQCTVCGEKQNSSVIPGWGKYYVKSPKAVAGKKSFTVKWGKQSKANLKKFNGYQIRYSTKKSMSKAKMVKVKKTASSKTIKKLKKKTKYFVQVRTYTKKSGKTFYSKWSPKKTVKTK